MLIADVNGDSRNDVLTGEQANAICGGGVCQTDWFEHTAADTWVKHVLVTGVYCHDLSFADLNGTVGPTSPVTISLTAKVFWLEHPLDPTQPWPAHQVDTGDTMGTQVADIDGDSVPDIVAGRAWYDNVNGDGSSWVRHPYTTLSGPEFVTTVDFSNRAKIVVLDLNGDGRLDIVSTLFTGPSEPGVGVSRARRPDHPVVDAGRARRRPAVRGAQRVAAERLIPDGRESRWGERRPERLELRLADVT